MTGLDRRPVSAGEVAALTRRLRALSEAGRDADSAERAEFLADKRDLLDRITDQNDRDDHGSEVETMTTEHPDPRRDEDERVRGDREAVWAEAPAAQIGGLWFTLDDDAPGGTRPLTETEYAEIAARVQATHDQALARDDEERGPSSRYAGDDGAGFDDVQGWAR
ncbi:MAG: hypothetical protein L0I76_13440 [Pseudonocardia sp.]|nr:hypothetical protein [Pseudonocardia sp.]